MNLLADPILTISGGMKLSLPGLFATMARNQVKAFPALRPHQRPAWHMFLVQLAALALRNGKKGALPTDAAEWAAALQELTPAHQDDAPWCLAVPDWRKPAFLQAPMPDGMKLSGVRTPDALDMLITARNHDLKQAVAQPASAEDWVFALVSLQTCEGYGGKGNHGIARMNGGSSSRPMLGLAPARQGDMSLDPSAWWLRDVMRLITTRPAKGQDVPEGPALLWCLDWPEEQQLDFRSLDPWFIEICRRIRLTETNGALSAQRTTSKAARIDARIFKGNTGDPWTPVHSDGRSLTLGGGDFNYKRLCNLMFSGDWTMPILAQPTSNETGTMVLVAEAFSRGNSKTEGFKSRTVPVPEKAVRLLSSDALAELAKAQMMEIGEFDTVLKFALAILAAGGDGDKVEKVHYTHAVPARRRFDEAADRLFFRNLWRRIAALSESDAATAETRRVFLLALMRAAEAEFDAAMATIPSRAVLRPRAEAVARLRFRKGIRKRYPELFDREKRMIQSEETPAKAVCAAAKLLESLAPGPLAELRRMDASAAAPVFWRLASRYPQTVGRDDKQAEWTSIIRILAILTERGDPAQRHPLHDSRRRFGAVLCDGGDRDNWPRDGEKPRPVFSEQRFAQLLASRGQQRAVLLERAARMLARNRVPGSGMNVVDIAWGVLKPDDGSHLAEHYYGRLDRAECAGENREKGKK